MAMKLLIPNLMKKKKTKKHNEKILV